MADFDIIGMGSTSRLTTEYINEKCRRLIDVRFFCCRNLQDMGRLLKFFRQRGIPYACVYNVETKQHEAVAVLRHEPPMKSTKIKTKDKDMATAYALIAVRLAELANI